MNASGRTIPPARVPSTRWRVPFQTTNPVFRLLECIGTSDEARLNPRDG